jgi:hypothetical protein
MKRQDGKTAACFKIIIARDEIHDENTHCF